jgi:hypothetical protein
MRRPAKILLAGTLVAILPCGAATSQVWSGQGQGGDVAADLTVNVDQVSDASTLTVGATGNSFAAGATGQDLDMRSNQTLECDVSATAGLNVGQAAGESTHINTRAAGNSDGSGVHGGTLTSIHNQTVGQRSIYANTSVEAAAAAAGDVTASTQAMGNSVGTSAAYGVSGVRMNQTNAASVVSDGGGVFNRVTGTASFMATTAGNTVTASGTYGSGQNLEVRQINDGALTQASQFTSYGSAYLTNTTATATANNIYADNQGPVLNVAAQQSNSSYVRAQADSNAYQYGAGMVMALGVGNSMMVSELGQESVIDSDQFNEGGGVDAVASFTGHQGYDVSATSTAIGNSAGGTVCATCLGRLQATNQQINAAGISATTAVDVTGGARSISGTAMAIGNSGSYYVNRIE